MRDHQPVVIKEFRGVVDRTTQDDVPIKYLCDGLNLSFKKGVGSRYGFSVSEGLTVGFAIKRMAIFKRSGEADRLLILDSSGNLYDSLNLVTPILTVVGMTDFSLLSMFNRAYISPHNGTTGLTSEKVYVYSGSGLARPAAGSPPSGGALVAADSASSGVVAAGQRLLAVSFITESGHLTKPGYFYLFTGAGDKKIDISNIPLGPAGTIGRRLLTSKIILDYNLDVNYYEYFFVPSGQINDNTTTSLSVDFYETELMESADYTFDTLETIPAGVNLIEYRGRMLVIAPALYPHTVLISETQFIETFNESSGYINCNPGDGGGGLKNGFNLRQQLCLQKSQRFYGSEDTGDEPINWPVIQLDNAIGTECHGVGKVLDSQGTNLDRVFIADRTGILMFTGSISGRITKSIDNIWDRINKTYFHKVELVVDPLNYEIFAAVPLDAATENSHIIYCDYSDGLDEETIKCCVWQINSVRPTTIVVDTSYTTKASIVKVGSLDQNIHALSATARNDTAGAINCYGKLGYLPQQSDGGIFHFGAIRLRVLGSGVLTLTMYGLDDASNVAIPSLTLQALPGREFSRIFNFQGEKGALKFSINTSTYWFEIRKADIEMKRLWDSRPLI